MVMGRHAYPALVLALVLPILAGCMDTPVTQGARSRLSLARERVMVVGNQPSAVGAAVTWLQARGLTAVTPNGPWTIPTGEEIDGQAKSLKAQVVVWVQQSGDQRAPMVSVRGTDVDSHSILWSGQARAQEHRAVPVADRIARLTCHALEAAWGDRAADARRPGFGEDCE